MKLKVYFRSSPNTMIYDNIVCLTTEGELVRFAKADGTSEWYPCVEIFRIVELK